MLDLQRLGHAAISGDLGNRSIGFVGTEMFRLNVSTLGIIGGAILHRVDTSIGIARTMLHRVDKSIGIA